MVLTAFITEKDYVRCITEDMKCFGLSWHDQNVKLVATLRGSRPGVQSASLIMRSLMKS